MEAFQTNRAFPIVSVGSERWRHTVSAPPHLLSHIQADLFISNALIHCGGANSVGHSLIVVFDRPQQVRDNAVDDDGRCIMCRSSDGPVIPLSSCPQQFCQHCCNGKFYCWCLCKGCIATRACRWWMVDLLFFCSCDHGAPHRPALGKVNCENTMKT